MASPQVNGEAQYSAFIDHLLRYPAVSDGVEAFKQNPYGQRSLSLGDKAYRTLAAPVLPYLSKPLEYVSPYVRRVDHLGDQTLSRVDARFPAAVRKPAGELFADAKSLVLLPYRKGIEGRDHVLTLYSAERKKGAGEAAEGAAAAEQSAVGVVVVHGKALVSTALIVTGETLDAVTKFLNRKKEQAHEVTREVTREVTKDKTNSH